MNFCLYSIRFLAALAALLLAASIVGAVDDTDGVDVCDRDKPCQNDGECYSVNSPSNYVCKCNKCFHGNNCEVNACPEEEPVPTEYFVMRIIFITLTTLVSGMTVASLIWRRHVIRRHEAHRLKSVADLKTAKGPVVVLPTMSVEDSLVYQLLGKKKNDDDKHPEPVKKTSRMSRRSTSARSSKQNKTAFKRSYATLTPSQSKTSTNATLRPPVKNTSHGSKGVVPSNAMPKTTGTLKSVPPLLTPIKNGSSTAASRAGAGNDGQRYVVSALSDESLYCFNHVPIPVESDYALDSLRY